MRRGHVSIYLCFLYDLFVISFCRWEKAQSSGAHLPSFTLENSSLENLNWNQQNKNNSDSIFVKANANYVVMKLSCKDFSRCCWNCFINMNENEQVTLNFRDQVGVDKLEEAPSSSLNLSPPSSPIRQEFVRFHSNSPGLKSLNDYYAFDLLPNVPEISKCVKTTDPLCPVNDTMADIEDCVQYFTAFVSFRTPLCDLFHFKNILFSVQSERGCSWWSLWVRHNLGDFIWNVLGISWERRDPGENGENSQNDFIRFDHLSIRAPLPT